MISKNMISYQFMFNLGLPIMESKNNSFKGELNFLPPAGSRSHTCQYLSAT